MSGRRTPDALPRTALAWQRTLLTYAVAAISVAVALERSGMQRWVLVVLLIAVLPVPVAVQRERQLLQADPPALSPWVAALLALGCGFLGAAALLVALN